jgi:hypothetical protein
MRTDDLDDNTERTTPYERDVTPHLVHLDDMADLQVADGDPDIRGWDVRTADGEKIGKVTDLVVDTGLMKVRYIEAEIDKDVLNASDNRAVLIPIGSARLDDDEDDVYLSSAIVDPRSLPAYDRRSLSREYEVALRERFPTGMEGGSARSRGSDSATPMVSGTATPLADRRSEDEDFYGSDLYDDTRFFGQRRRGREGSNYIGPTPDQDDRRADR